MGAEPVVVLYASISVLNLIRAATGSQCKETKRGVTCALLGSLNPWSFIHAEMSAKQPEIRAATVGSSGRNEK